ncbi:MAG: bifunctional (p)ppGpp synthetase/guanosine-3',5'-bis(diphosphate) 3'-pyrophosphohydrolase [Candidatus Saganbacteria bacterium]|nr:bifunctional (p)ppGpp synthetase/guanosine-3',5'-bis(diphosphate) 3'-pyrophosphohydrolase [Candidatus Saganbacteria bacterium]
MQDITELLEKIKFYAPSADLALVQKAADFSSKVHEGQKRLSGDPYISHPIAVAKILAELEQDSTTIAAALLHDTIEDASVDEKTLTREFGGTITKLVAGITKLRQLTFESREQRQAENFRKMFFAMAEDIRIIIIKLADRLHNMKTLDFLSGDRQLDIAAETREIYAPLAHRLGMWRLKWELEDLSFYYLERDKYDSIKNLVNQKREEREKFVNEFIAQVTQAVLKVEINASIAGRSKHFYSIYNKIVQKNVEFDDIYDLIAIRVIVDSVKDCYAVLGVIHSIWKPIPGRFRDFIAIPKSNGYQSLHTTVMGSFGKPVEIQIRTKEMHKVAEYGVAAHWRYKEGATDSDFDAKLAWLRQMLEYQKEVKDAKDFLENLKIDLFIDEVFVYSPKGDVYDLPIDATPVDFAYHVHTQVGHRCVGAKVNGKIVPLDHRLSNGDIVEILTSNKDNPKLNWLNFVRTSGGKTKIKQWFKKQKREENIDRGKASFEEELKSIGVNDLSVITDSILKDIYEKHNAGTKEDLFALIGNGELSSVQLARECRKSLEKNNIIETAEEEIPRVKTAPQKEKKTKQGINVRGMDNILIRLGKCCFPLPGDEIIGFVTKGRGITVHRLDCSNVAEAKDINNKVVEVEWDKLSETAYPVNIEIEAFDRVGVLKDILSQISETKTNIESAEIRTKRGSSAILNLVVDVRDTTHLKIVTDAIRKISDVYDVHRFAAVK